MLYHLLYPLHETYSIFNVFKYITFRVFGAGLTALFFSLTLGPLFIRMLKGKKMGQVIRPEGPSSHASKEGTPTMGGLLILTSLILSTLLWVDLTNTYVWCVLATTCFYGLIGFVDDYLKISRKSSRGLSAKTKLLFQMLGALMIALWLYYQSPSFSADLSFPFFKNLVLSLSWGYIPFIVLVIVGTSNAVNLTDGLDGLAIGPIMTAAGTFLLLSYVAGHFKIAQYLQVVPVNGAGELSIFCAAMVTSGLGFLWYASYPAAIFMGDVGSLALGGALGVLSIMVKQEVLLVIVGGIFVAEAVSVMCQVASFKLTRKRIFKMAPLHHHFEMSGWAEPKIVVRFWIISIILAMIALSTLKLR